MCKSVAIVLPDSIGWRFTGLAEVFVNQTPTASARFLLKTYAGSDEPVELEANKIIDYGESIQHSSCVGLRIPWVLAFMSMVTRWMGRWSAG